MPEGFVIFCWCGEAGAETCMQVRIYPGALVDWLGSCACSEAPAVQLQLGHRLPSWDEPQNFVVCSLERMK